MNTPVGPTDEPNGAAHAPDSPASSARRRGHRRTYSRHGLTTLRAAVRSLGPRVIDKRTTLGKQLAEWKADLERDLRGNVSTQQSAVIDLAVRTKLLLDSIDAWLLVQPSLVNARKRALLPAVKERQGLADALARYLGQLGLERRAKPAEDLTALLARHTAAPPAAIPTDTP